MQTQLFKKYIRNENHEPRGVVVLVRDETGKDHFGYSLCNPRDKFDKKLGTAIALARATSEKLKEDDCFIPLVSDRRELVADYYLELQDRAYRYFKH